MEQSSDAIRLGLTLAEEYQLSPEKNSFTAAHPNSYYYGVFCACTGRPMPEREQAKRGGNAPSAHAYEVLKLGFADASNALGRPVLIYSNSNKPTVAKPKFQLPDLGLREKFFQYGKPTPLFMFLLIIVLSVLLFVLQIISKGGQLGTPQNTPVPGGSSPAEGDAAGDRSI